MAEFECREAAMATHLSFNEFQALHWSEKAKTVAFVRLHNRIDEWQSYQGTQS